MTPKTTVAKKRRTLQQICREAGDGIIIAVATCFLLFVFAPAELFLTNQSSFWFTLFTMLPVILSTFAILSLLAAVALFICNFISNKLYHFASVSFFILLIASYVQGNFLVSGLPQLDGMKIDWNRYQSERIKTVILWIIVILIMALLIRKFKMPAFMKGARLVSICMFLLLVSTLAALAFTSRNTLDKSILTATTENMFEMSEDTNFIILMLDAVDSETLNQLAETGEIADVENIFQDFTYFTNTVGAYSCTKHSVPFIMSGIWYENECTFDSYIDNVFTNSSLLAGLEERSYKIGLYDNELMPSAENNKGRFDNMAAIDAEVSSYFSFAKLLIKLGGIKYAPYDLKRYCYAIAYNFGKVRKLPEAYDFPVFEWDNDTFYQSVQSEEISLVADKCFRFIHVEGAHAPFHYDKNMNTVQESDYESCVAASITLTKAYLEKLKASGVYDNSIIIVMADHGFDSELADQGHTFEGRQNPILFIKGLNEHHELQISQAPISFEDLPEAYGMLLNGSLSTDCFPWSEGDYRERRYLYYDLNDGVGEKHMVEYIQTGDAKDSDTLLLTGREFYYNASLATP